MAEHHDDVTSLESQIGGGIEDAGAVGAADCDDQKPVVAAQLDLAQRTTDEVRVVVDCQLAKPQSDGKSL